MFLLSHGCRGHPTSYGVRPCRRGGRRRGMWPGYRLRAWPAVRELRLHPELHPWRRGRRARSDLWRGVTPANRSAAAPWASAWPANVRSSPTTPVAPVARPATWSRAATAGCLSYNADAELYGTCEEHSDCNIDQVCTTQRGGGRPASWFEALPCALRAEQRRECLSRRSGRLGLPAAGSICRTPICRLGSTAATMPTRARRNSRPRTLSTAGSAQRQPLRSSHKGTRICCRALHVLLPCTPRLTSSRRSGRDRSRCGCRPRGWGRSSLRWCAAGRWET